MTASMDSDSTSNDHHQQQQEEDQVLFAHILADLIPNQRDPIISTRQSIPITPNLSIEISQDSRQGCGGMIWQAAGILSRHIIHRLSIDPLFLRSKRCIELGAGTGIVGLSLAKFCGFRQTECGMDKLILTDLDFLCELMRENVRLNGLHAELDSQSVVVLGLPWGQPLSGLMESFMPVDLVLISDCVYLESCFDLLLDTLTRLLVSPHTLCLMSYMRRRRAEKRFFQQLRKLFDVQLVQDDPDYEQYSRERLFIYEIRKKQLQ